MLKKIAGSVAALTIAVAGLGLVGTAAQAQGAGTLVTADQIQPTETTGKYTTWHQGMNPGGRFASTVEGLLVEGNSQIIKGETSLPDASGLLAYAQSSTIESSGGPVWHQIGFGLEAAPEVTPPAVASSNWTTLRSTDGVTWTTSQPFNGLGKNQSADLERLLGGLTGKVSYLSGGFYVDKKVPATISSYSVNNVTTSFALPALSPAPNQDVTVLSTDIRPDESTYPGWHDGAAAGGSFESTTEGLEVVGKVQILNGEASSSTQVAQFVTGLALETESPDVWY